MLYPISIPKPNSAEDWIGYIDRLGRVVVEPSYGAGAYFSEGLAAVCRDDGLSGFIDADCAIKIPFQYRGVGLFHEGFCSIGQGSRAGYLNRSGRWQIEPRFAVAGRFSEGFAQASLDGSSFGYVDRAGIFIVRPLFEQLGVFCNGLGAARQEGKWGYLGRDGSVLIPFQFEGPRAQVFTNGRAGVCMGGRWGFIDAGGGWIVMPQYEDVRRFHDGFAPLRHSGKWGVIDAAGRIRTAPTFDELGEFDEGMAAASMAGRAGFVSPEGEWIIEQKFDKCYRFVGDLAIVRNGNTRIFFGARRGSGRYTSALAIFARVPLRYRRERSWRAGVGNAISVHSGSTGMWDPRTSIHAHRSHPGSSRITKSDLSADQGKN